MGGLIELKGDTLNLQGNVFKACNQEEATALLEGRADYNGMESANTVAVETAPIAKAEDISVCNEQHKNGITELSQS